MKMMRESEGGGCERIVMRKEKEKKRRA